MRWIVLALTLASCGEMSGVEYWVPYGAARHALRPAFDQVFDSPGGSFRVHYTNSGVDAVPDTDDDISGVPDFVEDVATIYDDVLIFYRDGLGYNEPLSDTNLPSNGGDGRFDVYLADFNGMGDGHFSIDACLTTNEDQCIGFMMQENDYQGYGYPSTHTANLILSSHEFFHAIQAAYNTENNPDDALGWAPFVEGTAVWATEAFDPSLNDFEYFIRAYFNEANKPLDRSADYGTAIFFKFLEERFDASVIRALWEACVNGSVTEPYWLEVLPDVLLAETGTSFGDALTEFASWNLFTQNRADPSRAYANGGSYPALTLESVTLPYSEEQLRLFYSAAEYYVALPGTRTEMTAALVAYEPADIEGLRLVVAVDHAGSYETVSFAEHTADVVSTAGATRVAVIVVNTATSGSSKRPGLCIGTPDEVKTCRDTFVPPPPPPPKKEDDGCSATRGTAISCIAPLALISCRRRRRR